MILAAAFGKHRVKVAPTGSVRMTLPLNRFRWPVAKKEKTR